MESDSGDMVGYFGECLTRILTDQSEASNGEQRLPICSSTQPTHTCWYLSYKFTLSYSDNSRYLICLNGVLIASFEAFLKRF